MLILHPPYSWYEYRNHIYYQMIITKIIGIKSSSLSYSFFSEDNEIYLCRSLKLKK